MAMMSEAPRSVATTTGVGPAGRVDADGAGDAAVTGDGGDDGDGARLAGMDDAAGDPQAVATASSHPSVARNRAGVELLAPDGPAGNRAGVELLAPDGPAGMRPDLQAYVIVF